MPVNSVAENAFGTAGTICWTIQLIPQLWKTYREKDTTGLSDWMILAWSVSGAFLGTYSIVKNLNIPLILQPQLFAALTMASWAQVRDDFQNTQGPEPYVELNSLSVSSMAEDGPAICHYCCFSVAAPSLEDSR
ncbi:hypothetical protein HHX47_DHR3000639 [Lentinula edodes]|nr:hypothetical protein HHX47_DHR3000639 [Lentinula edodes]